MNLLRSSRTSGRAAIHLAILFTTSAIHVRLVRNEGKEERMDGPGIEVAPTRSTAVTLSPYWRMWACESILQSRNEQLTLFPCEESGASQTRGQHLPLL